MRSYYILAFILLFNQASAQETFIPDINFELALINLGVDDIQDYQVLTSSIDTITSLDIRNLSINNLTGIHAFSSLVILECDSNSLGGSLDFTSNTFLASLSCSNNQISSLTLSANLSLSSLDCSFNNLSTLDLSSNIALIELSCTNNQLNNLNIKNGNNINITSFYCTNNASLFCIDVDDPEWSDATWTTFNGSIDIWNNFNLNCSTAFGCLDTLACNYDSIASYSDSSCIYPTLSSFTESYCDFYSWNNITYTSSGTYTYSTLNSNGCDSAATLNLTINPSTTSTTDVTA